MKRLTVIGVLGLAGCASVLGPSIDQSYAAISAYEGRQLQSIVDRIGYPDREERVLDATAYYWGQDRDTGPVCVWKAVAGNDGIVRDTEVYGNPMGCERETEQLQ